MKKILFSIAILFSILAFSQTTHAIVFPANDPGVDIGINLDRGYEPSGIVWHKLLQSLFLVWDNGYVTQMDINGNIIHPSVFIGGGFDIEDVTIIDENDNLIYLLQEYPQAIVEYDISTSTWSLTGRRWNLLGMPGGSRDGAEALTYKKSTHEFYVGAQSGGNIYVYDIDLSSPSSTNFSRMIDTHMSGRGGDISGLNYSEETNHIYALFDGANVIQEYDSHDQLASEEVTNVPGHEQEGLVILPGCPNASAPIIIAEDAPVRAGDRARVMKYNTYPLACIPSMTDNDRDGYMADVDCKDNDATVHPGALEILNDGKNNDCSSRTPDYVHTYTAQTLRHPFATEVRWDYHVFDTIGEYSYIQIPANLKGQWYTFELEARANSLDQLYSMGIYIPRLDLRQVDLQVIDRDVWKTYTFTKFIPASTPVDVRFISNVTGRDKIQREHYLRSVKVTRLEQTPNPFILR